MSRGMFERKEPMRKAVKIFTALIVATTVTATATLDTITPVAAQGFERLLQGAYQSFAISNLSDEQEVALGKQINQQLIAQGQVRLSRNRRTSTLVNRIGQRIARTSDRPDIPYTFQVADDKAINAFATAGGYVYVTTGLLQATNGSDAQLAGVIAHEVGHIVGRHALDQMRKATLAQGITGALGVDNRLVVNLGVNLLQRSYSREAEYEADKLGLENLVRAGYPASGLPDFLRKLERGGGTPEFLSTHPSSPSRVERLEQIIREENLDRRG